MFNKIITIGMVLGLLIVSGCKITKENKEDFEREYKRHKEQQEEPYIPVPEV